MPRAAEYYDDGMDEPMSTYPTEYDDEYYGEDEEPAEEAAPPPPPAFKMSAASDDARRKEQAAETRRTMKEAEEKRAASAEEVHAAAAWLAQRGFATDGVEAAGTMRLYRDMKARDEGLSAELDAITKSVATARVNREARRVHVAGPRCFFVVTASWAYPSAQGENLSVDSNNRAMRAAVGQLVSESAKRAEHGFLTQLVAVLAELSTATDADVAEVWKASTGEALALRSTRRTLAVELTPVQRDEVLARHQRIEAMSRRALAAQRRRQQDREKSGDVAAPVHSISPAIFDVHRDVYNCTGREFFDASDSQAVAARDNLASMMANSRAQGSETLTASDLPLVVVPRSIAQLTNLTSLSLHNCHLRNIPDFGRMRLQKLYLSNNQIDMIPATLFDTARKGLRILDLSHNNIDVLPDGMAALSQLEILQVEYNRVKRMCDVAHWPKLEVLELTDNCLREVPAAVVGLKRLWRLKIGANPLENLPAEVYYQGLEKVREYLSELTTTSLPVARRRLAADIAAQCDVTSPDAWCDVVLVSGEHSRAVPSYLLEARMPGLTKLAVAMPVCADGGRSPTHRIDLPVALDDFGLQALVELLCGSIDAESLKSASATQTVLGEIISSYGSSRLMAQLTSVLRGHEIDANDVLSDDLTGLAMHAAKHALDTSDEGAATESGVFRVGDLVTIVAGPMARRFVVHRGLLAARCPFFANMFRSGLADADAAEVPMEEVDPEIFAGFLTYVYADSASKLSPENVVALLFLAVELNVERLRDLAEAMVGFNVEVDNVAQVIQLAYFLDSDRLKNACMYFVHNNYAAVRSTEGYHQLQDEVKKELADKLAKWNSAGQGW